MPYPSRFINVVRFPIENCLYRRAVRRRSRIVTTMYETLPPQLTLQQMIEKRLIEFFLDRCEMAVWHVGHWYHAYLATKGFTQ